MYLVLGLLYFMLYYLKNLLLKKEFKFQSKLIFKLFLNGSSKLDKLSDLIVELLKYYVVLYNSNSLNVHFLKMLRQYMSNKKRKKFKHIKRRLKSYNKSKIKKGQSYNKIIIVFKQLK